MTFLCMSIYTYRGGNIYRISACLCFLIWCWTVLQVWTRYASIFWVLFWWRWKRKKWARRNKKTMGNITCKIMELYGFWCIILDSSFLARHLSYSTLESEYTQVLAEYILFVIFFVLSFSLSWNAYMIPATNYWSMWSLWFILFIFPSSDFVFGTGFGSFGRKEAREMSPDSSWSGINAAGSWFF